MLALTQYDAAPLITLRPYQETCVERVLDAYQCTPKGGRALLVLPTGGGKTLVFAEIARRLGLNTLIIAHRQELLQQAADKFRMIDPTAIIGQVGAGRHEWGAPITVASVQTISRPEHLKALARFGYDLVVIDECHHSAASGYQAVLDALPDAFVLGVTATPDRLDKQSIEHIFGAPIFSASIIDMIEQGYLSNLRAIAIPTTTSLDGLHTQDGDFKLDELEVAVDTPDRNERIVNAYLKHCNGRQGLCFAVTVAHAEHLAETFTTLGVPASVVSGETPPEERKRILHDYERGALQVLCNCLDAKTEILTQRGWVGMETIQSNDITATINPLTGSLEWQPISRIVRRHRAAGERMVRIKNQTLDVRVTEGHRMMVRAPGAVAWSFVEAGTLPNRKGPYELPLAAEVEAYPGVPLTDAELEFLGLFATDGSLNWKRGSIEIAQAAKSPMCAEIERILTACGFDWKYTESTYTTTKGVGTYRRYRIPKGTIGGQLARHGWGRLEAWLDKSLSPCLGECTRAQFIKLLYGLWVGDGLKDAGNTRSKSAIAICGADWVMFDRLQTWATTRGFASNMSIRPNTGGGVLGYIRIRDRKTVQTNNRFVLTSGGNPATFEAEWYDEEVWCVTNTNGTILTRRNGHVTAMGQCGVLTEGYDAPQTSCILMARPTKSRALYVQCLDASTEILTPDGWKSYQDIQVGTLVAGYDKDTEAIQWVPALSKVERPLAPEETMVKLVAPTLDIRVTGGHRMLYRTRYGRKRTRTGWDFIEAQDLFRRELEYEIPISGLQAAVGVPLTDDELRFIGWFLTDGTLNRLTNQISIYQAAHQPYHDAIKSCIEGCGFKYRILEETPVSQYHATSQRIRYTLSKGQPRGTDKHLTGWGKLAPYIDKNFSPLLEEMTAEQLEVMLEALHLGDGNKQRGQTWTQRSYHIITGNNLFAERLQSLCVRRGFKCNVSQRGAYHTLHIKKISVRYIGGKSATDRPHMEVSPSTPGETVWCVENELGTLVTRRNGKVAIVGNCIGRGTRLAPGKTDCIILDITDNSLKLRLEPLTLGKVVEMQLGDGESIIEAKEREKQERELASELLEARERTTRVTKREQELEINLLNRFDWKRKPNGGYSLEVGENKHKVILLPSDSVTGYYSVWARLAPDFKMQQWLPDAPLEWAQTHAEMKAKLIQSSEKKLVLVDSNAPWRSFPVSNKQLYMLRKFDIPFTEAMTSGEASDLIGREIAKREKEKAEKAAQKGAKQGRKRGRASA